LQISNRDGDKEKKLQTAALKLYAHISAAIHYNITEQATFEIDECCLTAETGVNAKTSRETQRQTLAISY